MCAVRPIAAKLFISLIEFFNSFISRFRAWAFISDDVQLVVVDEDCCDDDELLDVIRRWDEVVFATREDVVVDELFNTCKTKLQTN